MESHISASIWLYNRLDYRLITASSACPRSSKTQHTEAFHTNWKISHLSASRDCVSLCVFLSLFTYLFLSLFFYWIEHLNGFPEYLSIESHTPGWGPPPPSSPRGCGAHPELFRPASRRNPIARQLFNSRAEFPPGLRSDADLSAGQRGSDGAVGLLSPLCPEGHRSLALLAPGWGQEGKWPVPLRGQCQSRKGQRLDPDCSSWGKRAGLLGV